MQQGIIINGCLNGQSSNNNKHRIQNIEYICVCAYIICTELHIYTNTQSKSFFQYSKLFFHVISKLVEQVGVAHPARPQHARGEGQGTF